MILEYVRCDSVVELVIVWFWRTVGGPVLGVSGVKYWGLKGIKIPSAKNYIDRNLIFYKNFYFYCWVLLLFLGNSRRSSLSDKQGEIFGIKRKLIAFIILFLLVNYYYYYWRMVRGRVLVIRG